MKRTTFVLLLAAMTLVLALSACVRPAPGAEDVAPATATPGLIVNPTLPLATLAPGGLDPNLGLASPTPLPPAATLAPASPTPLPPAPIPPTATTAPAVTGEQIHVVQAGENLFRIGLRYGFTVQELATYNNIVNVDRIDVGQEIRIPAR